jgi:hypothetical protein
MKVQWLLWQRSSVHGSSSEQSLSSLQQFSMGSPGEQNPNEQLPVSVQGLPSSHGTLFITRELLEQQAVT